MQYQLAGISLDDLLLYKESDDVETQRLAKWELQARYAPCVRGKDDKIKLDPHHLHDTQWQTARNEHGVSTKKRECITYEDPEAPNAEWYDYADRISSWYKDEEKENARKVANESAKPSTDRWLESYLSTLTGKKIRVNRVITGIGSDGYAWNAFGQSEIKDTPNEETKEQIAKVIDDTKE